MNQAACATAGIPLEEWVPDIVRTPTPARFREVCSRCPIQLSCFEFAVRHDVRGYWAGTTDSQRWSYRRKRGIVVTSVTDWINRELGLPSEKSQALTRQYAAGSRDDFDPLANINGQKENT